MTLSVLSALGNAQMPWGNGWASNNPCLPYDPENEVLWPTDPMFGSPTEFGRLVVGDLDGDGAVEGALTASGVAVVLLKLQVYSAPVAVQFVSAAPATGVTALTMLPGGGSLGADALVLADARGVYIVGSLSAPSALFDDPVVLASGAWTSAALVRACDLDGDADSDLLGIAADKRSILTLSWNGTSFVPGVTIPLPHKAKDVVSMEWDPTVPGLEFVALTGRGLLPYTASGAALPIVSHVSNVGAITAFLTGSFQQLAWARGTSTGNELVLMTAASAANPPPGLALEVNACESSLPLVPTSIQAGNYNNDANEELLVTHDGNPTALLYRNLGAAPYFATLDPLHLDVVTLASDLQLAGGVGIPAFEQIDGADEDDLAFPVEATATVAVFTSLPRIRAVQTAPITTATIVSQRTEFGPDGSVDNRLRLGLQIPSAYSNAGYEFVDVIVWNQLNPSSAAARIPTLHLRYPLHRVGTTITPTQWIRIGGDGTPQDLDLLPTGICWAPGSNGIPACFYTEFRFVRVTGGLLRSPIFIGGFTLKSCGTGEGAPAMNSYIMTLSQRIPASDFPMVEDDGLLDGTGVYGLHADKDIVGLYVPMSARPAFENGLPPIPGTATPTELTGIPFTP